MEGNDFGRSTRGVTYYPADGILTCLYHLQPSPANKSPKAPYLTHPRSSIPPNPAKTPYSPSISLNTRTRAPPSTTPLNSSAAVLVVPLPLARRSLSFLSARSALILSRVRQYHPRCSPTPPPIVSTSPPSTSPALCTARASAA